MGPFIAREENSAQNHPPRCPNARPGPPPALGCPPGAARSSGAQGTHGAGGQPQHLPQPQRWAAQNLAPRGASSKAEGSQTPSPNPRSCWVWSRPRSSCKPQTGAEHPQGSAPAPRGGTRPGLPAEPPGRGVLFLPATSRGGRGGCQGGGGRNCPSPIPLSQELAAGELGRAKCRSWGQRWRGGIEQEARKRRSWSKACGHSPPTPRCPGMGVLQRPPLVSQGQTPWGKSRDLHPKGGTQAARGRFQRSWGSTQRPPLRTRPRHLWP